MRWGSAGGWLCALVLLAGCNTFDEPSDDGQSFGPPSFRGPSGPRVSGPFPAGATVSFAGVGGRPAFAGSGAGAGVAGAAGSGAAGRGGWMIIDAGTADDAGADDAGR